MDEQYTFHLRRLLCDWQMPDCLPSLHIDIDCFVDRLVEVGAGAVEFTAKSAFGSSLYPTRVGRVNPGMTEGADIFGELCCKARERGIQVVAYVNVLLDLDVSGEREAWVQRDISGMPLSFESYPIFCMNAPYIDFISRHTAEVVEKYDVDGLMLDIQYWHRNGCFCGNCRSKFRDRTGNDLQDAVMRPENWVEFARFQEESRRDFLLELKRRTDAVRPGLAWTWNGSGNFSPDFELDEHLAFFGSEAHPPAYDACSSKAKWIRSRGKPFELWMPESIGSWGHHTLTTSSTLKGTSALALANGGAVTVNHAPVPAGDYAGRVYDDTYTVIRNLFSWIGERERFCTDSTTASECAVLHSTVNTYFERGRRIAAGTSNRPEPETTRTIGQSASVACAALLDQIQMPYDFIAGEQDLFRNSGHRIDEYRCIILPNVGIMTHETADSLRRYVHGGGSIIAFYTSSLLGNDGRPRKNFLLSDVFGVEYEGFSDYSTVYLDDIRLPLSDDFPAIPQLIKDTGYQTASKNRAILCRTDSGAETVATLTMPILEASWRDGRHIFHDHAPAGTRTDYPGIVRNRFGAGTSVFLPVPLLESFAHLANPWYREIMHGCLRLVGLPHLFETRGPVSARVVVNSRDGSLLVHIIRIQQETGGILLDRFGTIDLDCICRPGWQVGTIVEAVSGREIEFTETSDGGVRFQSGPVNCHVVFEIKPRSREVEYAAG